MSIAKNRDGRCRSGRCGRRTETLGGSIDSQPRVTAGGTEKHAVDLSGHVALEAADDLPFRLALSRPAEGVGLGGWVPAQAHENNAMEGSVGLPIATAVEPMAD